VASQKETYHLETLDGVHGREILQNITMNIPLCVCVCVRGLGVGGADVLFQFLNQLTDFRWTWREYYAVGCHLNVVNIISLSLGNASDMADMQTSEVGVNTTYKFLFPTTAQS
jgi:hypothetical protein